jgi:hypothetical protein
MTGPSAPPLPTRGRTAHPNRFDVVWRWPVLIRAWAVLAAAALAAVVVVAACSGPSTAAIPRPSPNARPQPPDTGR